MSESVNVGAPAVHPESVPVMLSAPGMHSGSTETLTRIKQLLKNSVGCTDHRSALEQFPQQEDKQIREDSSSL